MSESDRRPWPQGSSAPPRAGGAGDRRQRRRAARRRRRRQRLLLFSAALAVLLSPALVSYTRWMLQPTSMSVGVRSVEWIKARRGGGWLVDTIEHYYYSFEAPQKGGPQLQSLPTVGLGPSRAGGGHGGSAWPRPIEPLFARPLPGEGVWKPTGPPLDGGPPVLVTTFRTNPAYPRLVAYAAWFDHTRTALAFYPGRYEPPRAAVRGQGMVPFDQRWRLLAAFNGGFTYDYGANGSTDNGRVNEPLRDGLATLVGYRDGRVAIVRWHGGPNAGPDVAWSRQSLPPILWQGKVNPRLDLSLAWGKTVGNAVRVWRTGVGIDRRGDLVFVAADGQTVVSLAKILQRMGAMRAMQFDINPYWHTLITYAHHHGLDPTMVEPQPNHSARRYLVSDDRDFFAVLRRLPGPVTVPFR